MKFFFVVPRNGPALLGMSDCKRLQLLSINCSTVEADQGKMRGNGQSRKDKFKQKVKN